MTEYQFPPLLSEEDMKKHKVPLPYRDRCAGLLVPLNICRREKNYLPWECEAEKHAYEECQYMDFQRRVKLLQKLKEEDKQTQA